MHTRRGNKNKLNQTVCFPAVISVKHPRGIRCCGDPGGDAAGGGREGGAGARGCAAPEEEAAPGAGLGGAASPAAAGMRGRRASHGG